MRIGRGVAANVKQRVDAIISDQAGREHSLPQSGRIIIAMIPLARPHNDRTDNADHTDLAPRSA